jgi:hypothetical protein
VSGGKVDLVNSLLRNWNLVRLEKSIGRLPNKEFKSKLIWIKLLNKDNSHGAIPWNSFSTRV